MPLTGSAMTCRPAAFSTSVTSIDKAITALRASVDTAEHQHRPCELQRSLVDALGWAGSRADRLFMIAERRSVGSRAAFEDLLQSGRRVGVLVPWRWLNRCRSSACERRRVAKKSRESKEGERDRAPACPCLGARARRSRFFLGCWKRFQLCGGPRLAERKTAAEGTDAFCLRRVRSLSLARRTSLP